jgi:hydroxymethylglutaryl-CoA reductase
MAQNSRFPGFYQKSQSERARLVADSAGLNAHEEAVLRGEAGLSAEVADKLIENVVGVHGLPLGIATNFRVNGRDVLIPMVIEEPSVVAGASYAAKLARAGGGFRATSAPPEMIGQVQVLDLDDLEAARAAILAEKVELLEIAGQPNPTILERGGGPRDLEVRLLPETPIGPMLVLHLIFDCRDAMGANMVNTACEALAEPIERISGGRIGLRILSNLSDRRLARAECTIPLDTLAFGHYPGQRVAQGIVEAWAFAVADPYRAATHNKGIMNGVDPVVIATGNDWRAIEAGAHAYAARSGRYTSLTTWGRDPQGNLTGSLEMPMAVGIVGGSTQVNPTTQVALRILGAESSNELAEIVVSVGLAQNLAALRALATEGIQKGHMALHAQQIAIAAGASGAQVEAVVTRLLAENQITLSRAESVLKELERVTHE